MPYALGIDLGTTYSAAAVGRDGQVTAETLGSTSSAIPSVVLLRADGEVLTGEAAERRSTAEPARTAREFKRRLGDPAPLILGGTPYGAEALQARLLRAIVDAVAERQGGAPDIVVLTHPANYGAYKRSLFDEIVKLADVGEVVLLTEPEAAAVDYASRDRLETDEVVAVYDFGGGTFDAAVLRKTADGFALLGTPEGIEHLGGIDFDQAVLAHVATALHGRLAGLDAADPGVRVALARLRDDCRTAKEALSADTDAVIPVALPGINEQVRITRPEFEAMIRPRIGETVAALERAVRSSGLAMKAISRILLVGGSSRIPLVAELVGAATGRPVVVDAHPKLAVALGAARFGLGRLAAAQALAVPAVVGAAAVGGAGTAIAAAADLGASDGATPPVGVEPLPARPARRRPGRTAMAAIGVAAVLIIGGLAFAATQQQSPGPSASASGTSSAPESAAAGSGAVLASPSDSGLFGSPTAAASIGSSAAPTAGSTHFGTAAPGPSKTPPTATTKPSSIPTPTHTPTPTPIPHTAPTFTSVPDEPVTVCATEAEWAFSVVVAFHGGKPSEALLGIRSPGGDERYYPPERSSGTASALTYFWTVPTANLSIDPEHDDWSITVSDNGFLSSTTSGTVAVVFC